MTYTEWSLATTCVCVAVLSLGVGQALADDTRPSVATTKGVVQGWIMESRSKPGTYMQVYKGIPYAKPPVKELRFLDPVAADSWSEALNLTLEDSSACPQMSNIFATQYSEDCLFINVFAPQNASANSKLPVMVWIYGGAFSVGSSSDSIYGPDYFVEQKVVFVSMNYRVNALGFLNLGTDKVPGNAGMKDQLLALQWVQTEIASFGGDPAKVTVFGESAGSASVTLQYLSPRSDNLFRFAIAESGNAFAEWPFTETGFLERAKTFSDSLNCTANGSVDLSCLQNVTVAAIIDAQENKDPTSLVIPFGPSLEKNSSTAFMDDTPRNLFQRLMASEKPKRPFLTGVNMDEGLFAINTPNVDFYKQFCNKLQDAIPSRSRANKTNAQLNAAVSILKRYYFNYEKLTIENIISGYVKFYTDTLFALSTAEFTRALAKNGYQVYVYLFEYDGQFRLKYSPYLQYFNWTGVAHADELGYLFWQSVMNQTAVSEDDPAKKTLRRMVKLWTNFVKSGNPTPDASTGTDDTLGRFAWAPITNGTYHYAIISEQLNMSIDNFKEESLLVWKEVDAAASAIRTSCSLSLATIVALFLYLV